MSSSTSMRGGSPASIGCSVRSRCANACRVDTAAPSSSSSATGGPGRGDRLAAAGRGLERAPDPVAQLGRRLLGEGDGGDLAHRHAAPGHQRDDAVDERLGLARARAGFDEQRLVERLDDRVARGEVLVEIEEALLHRVAGLSRRSTPLRRPALRARRRCVSAQRSSPAPSVSSSRRGPRVRRARRSRATPVRPACAATRGNGRGCRGRRGRCSCGSGGSRCVGGSTRHGNTPASMPSAMARRTSSTRASTSGESTSSAQRNWPRVLDVPVRRAHGRVGIAERRPRRVCVDGELEHPAGRGRVLGVDAVRAAGLVVDHPQRRRRRCGRPGRRRRGTAGRGRRRAGGRRRVRRRRSRSAARWRWCARPKPARVLVSSVRNRSSSASMPSPVAVPEQPAAGAPLRLVDPAPGLGDLAQAVAVGVGPRLLGRGRTIRPREHLAQERVERLVHQAAAVEGRHLVALLGQLGDVDAQDVLEEVLERVGGVGLQAGGRHHDVAVGHAAGVVARPGCRRTA